jgi:hypothetical protein
MKEKDGGDSRVYGLNNWKDGVAIDWDRETKQFSVLGTGSYVGLLSSRWPFDNSSLWATFNFYNFFQLLDLSRHNLIHQLGLQLIPSTW